MRINRFKKGKWHRSLNLLIILILILLACLFLASCALNKKPLVTGALREDKGSLIEAGRVYSEKKLLVIENGELRLALNPENCSIEVTNLKDGSVWASNPPSDYEDEIAAGSYRTDLHSQLIVSYTTADNTTIRKTNSQAGSVAKQDFEIYVIKDGIRVHYNFNTGFLIPVVYQIKGGTFTATILYDEIIENKKELLNEITLLPYFGLADKNSDGYMMIPDGSGALIELNNGKVNAPSYEKLIYGNDYSVDILYETSREQDIKIPIFGMKRGDSAYCAIVEEGDGYATINAAVSGQKTSFNTLNVTGIYRVSSTVYVMSEITGSRNVLYNAKDATGGQRLSVSYTFLEGEKANYSGMAEVARNYFKEKGLYQKKETKESLHIEFYGGINAPKSFVGIQYVGKNALTRFEDANKIIADLKNEGVGDISAAYRYFSESEFSGKSEINLKPAKVLGGNLGIERMMEYLEQEEVEIFFHADISSLRKSGNGISRYFDTSKTVNLGKVSIYPMGLHSNIPDLSKNPYYLTSPSKYENMLTILANSADKQRIRNIYFTDTVSKLVSDFRIGGIQRGESDRLLSKLFKGFSKEYNLLMSNPNAYLYPYAAKISDLPLESSKHLLFDKDIPFLQMILKGAVPYTAPPFNLSGVSDSLFLKHVETMSQISYAFIYEDPDKLINTKLINQYGLAYSPNRARAVDNAKRMAYILSELKGAYIKNHTTDGILTKTQFSNGIDVYVNYGESAIRINEITIRERGFVIAKAGKILISGDEDSVKGGEIR